MRAPLGTSETTSNQSALPGEIDPSKWTQDEIRLRVNALMGPKNWFTGFPCRYFAKLCGVDRQDIYKWRKGKLNFGKVTLERVRKLLVEIECGMITCTMTQESRIPEQPWMKSYCKHVTRSPVPTKPIRPLHQVKIGIEGPSLRINPAPQNPGQLPSFLGAFAPKPKKF